MDSDSISILIVILFLALFVAEIIAVIFLVKQSDQKAVESEKTVNRLMMRLSTDKQFFFTMQYRNVKKNPTTAVILAFFLGGLGVHKFYLGNIGMGLVYLLFSWTTIPGIIGFVEAFGIAGKVREMNESRANQIASIL